MMLVVDSCACKSPNSDRDERYLHVGASLRDCLRLFKGCRLSVLVALALRSDERGLVSVDKVMLSAETGYDKATVAYTIADLCRLRVNNRRVLMQSEQSSSDGALGDTSYQLFPSDEEKVVDSRESSR